MLRDKGALVAGIIALGMAALFVLPNQVSYFVNPGQVNMRYKEESIFPDYRSTLGQKDGDVYVVNNPDSILVLVNKERRLPDMYRPTDLVIPDVRFSFHGNDEKKMMRKEAARALEQLFQAAEEANIHLFAVSAFRSYERQKVLHAMYEQKEGEAVTAVSSAMPGASEHQTGLSVDISSESARFQLEPIFGETKEGTWLAQHAHEFGFIIRYPENKTHVTGYMYEPWHIRYVGISQARFLYEKRLTLEEAMPK